MRSFYVLTATLLASPFVSAQQRKVEVDMRALASLEDALYNLQSSMSVPAGQNVDDANTPQTCSNKDNKCKEKNFKTFTGCWQNCVASKSTDNPLAVNCARFCTDKCGCDKSKDPYWGEPLPASGQSSSQRSSTDVSTNGRPTVVVSTDEEPLPELENGIPNVVVDTDDGAVAGPGPRSGPNRPSVVVDTVEEPLSKPVAGRTQPRNRASWARRARI